MATTSINQLKRELLYSIRNSDILSVATRGVTTTNETFSGDNSETEFTLSNIPVKNIRSITVDAVSQEFITDWDFNPDTGLITFTSAPASGTNNISVDYDYGTTDRIFPDFPQPTIKLDAFPRIGFDIIGGVSTEFELGAATNQVTYNVSIVCYDKDQQNVEVMISDLRAWLVSQKKSFTLFPIITLTSTGPLLVAPYGQQKVMQRSQDADILFIFDS